MTALKTLIFIILFPGFVLFYVPLRMVPHTIFDLGLIRYLAVAPWAIGTATVLWCAWDFTFRGRGTPAPFDPPKELVVSGPYRFVRNPMYIGAILILLGHALRFGSLELLIYAAAIWLVFHLFVLIYEEPHLRRTFGDSYLRYCQSVHRWLPHSVPY